MKRGGLSIAGILAAVMMMCRTANVYASETAQVLLFADAQVTSAYSVKADPFLELFWNKSRKDYEGTYQVGVKGRLPDGKVIRIIPDASFQMTSGKKTRTGTVKQEFTRWAMKAEQADTLILSETEYVTTIGTAAIKLPGTGVYRGGIQFTFSME